jgi:hypothetical protein
VWPCGDYPVNDDWQYARILARLATTGRFLVDVDVAPSLVGQIWLTLPFVKLFGFSHTLLRACTAAASAFLVWIVDRILDVAGTRPAERILTAALLIGNPIFLHLAFSYMTESYGYALALSGALVWLRARARRPDTAATAIGWRDALLAATLVGASFWIRQFCVAVFPALVGAAVFPSILHRQRRRLQRTLPVLIGATLWFSAIVLAYFAWARLSHSYRAAFDQRVGSLVHVSPKLILLSAFELTAYLTLFLFPFLILERWRDTRWRRFAGIATGIIVAIALARWIQPQFASFHHHAGFPFSANVVNDTGVGPITFTTTYWNPDAPRPHWRRAVWTGIEWLLLGAMVLWSRVFASNRDDAPESPIAGEVSTFGVFFAAIAFALYVQAFQREVLDRYFFPCVIGIAIALGARASRGGSARRQWIAIAAAAPVCWFAIAGVHDYFRWNDARWQAVALAEADGARPELIDGGYEVNGWLNYDASISRVVPAGCRGTCGCLPRAYFCTDDSYMIAMEAPPGRTVVARLPVPWWLAPSPDIVLSRR